MREVVIVGAARCAVGRAVRGVLRNTRPDEMAAEVLTGGDVEMGTEITEQQMLDLEREAFLYLCGTQKTQERIQYFLTTGRPLRN